ncbi:MAG TPA: DsbA family protein [Candidatus Saccharimonadia bacterium]
MSREAKVMIGILVVVVGAMVGIFALANKSGPTPVGDKTKVIRDNSHKTGSGTVQLVEFGDYQCPACGKAYPDVKQIMKDYDGKVTLYFRNFPLSQHPLANNAALAAEAAGAQGKYWEMHDKLYDNQSQWGDLNKNVPKSDALNYWVSYAKDLGLDADKFKSDVENAKSQPVVDQDLADGNALGIQGTPTFFVNGKQITSGIGYASLRDAINSALGQ